MAEVVLLLHDADDNTASPPSCWRKNNRCFDTHNQVAVAAVCAVAPMGAIVEEHLCALPAQVMEVTNYVIR